MSYVLCYLYKRTCCSFESDYYHAYCSSENHLRKQHNIHACNYKINCKYLFSGLSSGQLVLHSIYNMYWLIRRLLWDLCHLRARITFFDEAYQYISRSYCILCIIYTHIAYNAIGGGGFLLQTNRWYRTIEAFDCERENKYFIKN